eukprot:Hpha_TRINITY_DN26950_c0_g1::TRINITY_DN26950_c0_g1_i1::g.24923::m.24923
MTGGDGSRKTAKAPPEVLRMRVSERREAEVMYNWLHDEAAAPIGVKTSAPLPPRETRLDALTRQGYRLVKPQCWDSLATSTTKEEGGEPVVIEDDDWSLSFEDEGGEPTRHDVDWYLEWFWNAVTLADPSRIPFPRKAPGQAKNSEVDREFAKNGLKYALPSRWFCFRLVHDGPPRNTERSPGDQHLWYYNFATGESVWEPPHGLLEHAEAYERLYRFTKLHGTTFPGQPQVPEGAAAAAAAFAGEEGDGTHQGPQRRTRGAAAVGAEGGRGTPPTAEAARSELFATGFGPDEGFYS